MTDDTLRALADRAEIRDLIAAYAQGADNPDMKLFFSVFTPDLVMCFDGVAQYEGLSTFRDAMFGGKLAGVTNCKIKTSTHVMVNERIEIDGDDGTGVVYCVSHLIGERDGKPYAATRGLTYDDQYRRTAEGWRIAYRRHTLKWLIEGVPSPVSAERPAQ